MYPNNQQPQAPPLGQQPAPNQYDFIYGSPAPKKSLASGSMKGRIIILAIGLVILLVVFLVIMSLLGRAGKAQTQKYTEIAQRQTEIIRLATIGEKKSRSSETRSFAITAQLTLSTSQSEMTKVVEKNGVSAKELTKQLSASKNTKSDQALDEAEKNNRFDQTFIELITSELNNYKIQLNSASSGATKSDSAVLENAFNQANTLVPETKK